MSRRPRDRSPSREPRRDDMRRGNRSYSRDRRRSPAGDLKQTKDRRRSRSADRRHSTERKKYNHSQARQTRPTARSPERRLDSVSKPPSASVQVAVKLERPPAGETNLHYPPPRTDQACTRAETPEDAKTRRAMSYAGPPTSATADEVGLFISNMGAAYKPYHGAAVDNALSGEMMHIVASEPDFNMACSLLKDAGITVNLHQRVILYRINAASVPR